MVTILQCDSEIAGNAHSRTSAHRATSRRAFTVFNAIFSWTTFTGSEIPWNFSWSFISLAKSQCEPQSTSRATHKIYISMTDFSRKRKSSTKSWKVPLTSQKIFHCESFGERSATRPWPPVVNVNPHLQHDFHLIAVAFRLLKALKYRTRPQDLIDALLFAVFQEWNLILARHWHRFFFN